MGAYEEALALYGGDLLAGCAHLLVAVRRSCAHHGAAGRGFLLQRQSAIAWRIADRALAGSNIR
jgi:hypothetical protein